MNKQKLHPWLKTIIFTSSIGGAFGLLTALGYYFSADQSSRNGLLLWLIPVSTAAISGSAGLLDIGADYLLRKLGVKNDTLRRVLDFFFAVGTVMTLLCVISYREQFQLPFLHRDQMFLNLLLGSAFGGIVAFVDYRIWKMRQKVLTLELENRYLSELAKKDAELHSLTNDLLIAEERNLLARELHDSISQGIDGINFAIHALRKEITQVEPENTRINNLLTHLEKTAQYTKSELRSIILAFKPSLLAENGLTEAIRLLSELFGQRQGIEIDLDLDEVHGLMPEQDMSIYRITQEAFTNVQKHASASWVRVTLKHEEAHVILTIEDNGNGFIPEQITEGNGLTNMRNRCREQGGTFTLQSIQGYGTKITSAFPIL